MTTFGITPQGFVLKRLNDIIQDMDSRLAQVQDPITLETLSLVDENDPLVQLRNAVADQISVCWEQLQMCYNSFIPTQASGAALSGLVQLNGLIRQISELDSTLRLRQQTETAGTGYVQIEAIYAAVAALSGVQFCRAYQNSTVLTDSRGIPGKSISVVVVGGTPQAIVDAIFAKAGCDLGYYGNNTLTCTDNQGISYLISFMRPTAIPIIISVSLSVTDLTQWPADGADRVKQALVDYAQYSQLPNVGLFPGAAVIPSRLYSPINTIAGHEINFVKVSRGIAAPSEDPTVIAWNEVAEVTTANITVTI